VGEGDAALKSTFSWGIEEFSDPREEALHGPREGDTMQDGSDDEIDGGGLHAPER